MIYESQNKLIILALIGFLGGILPISLPIRNTKSYLNSTNIVYAQENTNTKGLRENGRDSQGGFAKETVTNLGESKELRRNTGTQQKDMEEPKSSGYAIPKSIIRFNRRSGKQESVRVPKEVGEAVCDPKYKWDCNKALTIISCESDFKADAISRTGDTGLFQIAPVHNYSVSYLSNIRNNIDVGYKLWTKQNWRPWKSSYSCWK